MPDEFIKFVKSSSSKIWEGFLQNLGVIICAFVLSGGYLIAINWIKTFQTWVRSIPSDYFLTPLVILLILSFVLIYINKKQNLKLSELLKEPVKDERNFRFVTHFGVWWKIFPDDDYIEDTPYCSCCTPHKKLVQINWYPEEKYKCPETTTEYELYDGIPRKKYELLDNLYNAYFYSLGTQFRESFFAELDKIKQLNPDVTDEEVRHILFKIPPLSYIPKEELEKVLEKHPKPMQAFDFIVRNYRAYRKYFRNK
ncbi:MAG: hypothetical protein WC374_02035 [Phycisphaerae bacterium]|jgi:hypothetical protein